MSEYLSYLTQVDGRLELVYPEYGLRLRAPYPEWLFEAAAEIIQRIEKLKNEGALDELELTREPRESSHVDVDVLKYEGGVRFNTVPQCLVILGENDYRWVGRDGRGPDYNGIGDRIFDTLLTRSSSGK